MDPSARKPTPASTLFDLHEFLEATGNLASAPDQRWRIFCQQHDPSGVDFDACQEAWRTIFSDWPRDRGPCPAWVPDPARIDESNVAGWMRETDCRTVEELHRWSVEHRSDFWEAALDWLDIAFREEPNDVFQPRTDRCSPDVLPGARLNIVESCFQASADQIAVITGRRDGTMEYHTYAELQSLTRRVARFLIEQGYPPGARIGVILPLTFESIAIYLGIILAGRVAVSIADSFAAPEIAQRLRIADAQAVFTCSTLYRAGKELPLADRVREATDLPLLLADDPQAPWRNSPDPPASDQQTVIANAADPINILFSSGTTGEPKAIPWNHATAIKCAVDAHLHHDLHPGDVVAWPTNLGWMMGPWLIFATLINRGTIAVYDDAPIGEGFGRFVQDARVNMLGLVPSLVRLWRASGCMESFDWTAIRCFSSTGEASNPSDMFYLSWLAGFRPIIEYCGGTEIGGGYISSTVIQNNVPASFSTPAFGLDIRILDEQHRPADEGELFLVPPSLGLSVELLNRDHDKTYFGDCPTDERGQRLRRHGDYFRRLPGGYFAAGGRADDTMNLGGIKVSSVEIEKTLNSLDEISETAAVAVPFDETGPDQLVVFYVLAAGVSADDEGEDALLKKMNEALRSRLNPLFRIGSIRRKDQLPRTASNKVMRRLLRDELRSKG